MTTKFTPRPWLDIWGDYDQNVWIRTKVGWKEATPYDINKMKASPDMIKQLQIVRQLIENCVADGFESKELIAKLYESNQQTTIVINKARWGTE